MGWGSQNQGFLDFSHRSVFQIKRKHNAAETGSVSVLGSEEGETYSGPLEGTNLSLVEYWSDWG
jgi:hypothetical protein